MGGLAHFPFGPPKAGDYNEKAEVDCKIRAFMKSLVPKLFLALACVVLATPIRAERADRNKPMNVEADTLRYDDVKQTSVFTGRVVEPKAP